MNFIFSTFGFLEKNIIILKYEKYSLSNRSCCLRFEPLRNKYINFYLIVASSQKMLNHDSSPLQHLTLPLSLNNERLDKALCSLLPLSREKVKKLIVDGKVTCNGDVVLMPSFRVKEGQVLQVKQEASAVHTLKGEDIPLSILFEDAHLLVLDKPSGMVVHPGAGNFTGTLVHALLNYCGTKLSSKGDADRPGIVHRLDKNTSGLMVVAKTDAAHQGLVMQFENRSLSRSYLAFVEGVLNPTTGVIEKSIARSDRHRKKMAVYDLKGKPAITEYRTLETFMVGDSILASLVECHLKTGRTHQIRVHLASLGHGILGDSLYGRQRKKAILDRLMQENPACSWQYGRQALHAYRLQFIHPVTYESLVFQSNLPRDLQELHALLKGEEG